MKTINLNQTFYNITHDDPALREALIEFGFSPMRNPQAYNTMGRIMTLKKGLEHINRQVDELKVYLEEKGISVDFHE